MSKYKPFIPWILVFIVIFILFWLCTPKDVAQKITKVNGPVPEIYEVNPGTMTYYYSVWVMPNGEKTVYICHEGGTVGDEVFGMALAVHPDGTPVTPEELGIDIPENMDEKAIANEDTETETSNQEEPVEEPVDVILRMFRGY